MGEISRARLLHVVGGLLGIASFFLPWVVVRGLSVNLGWTSADMVALAIQILLGDDPFAGIAPIYVLGIGVVGVGLLALLVASGFTLVSPYGGPLMFIATVVSSLGLTVMTIGTVGTIALTVDYGALLAFSAATLAIVGLILHRASMEEQKSEISPTEG